jgi:hypothetical protein
MSITTAGRRGDKDNESKNAGGLLASLEGRVSCLTAIPTIEKATTKKYNFS